VLDVEIAAYTSAWFVCYPDGALGAVPCPNPPAPPHDDKPQDQIDRYENRPRSQDERTGIALISVP
jgi:hypothetical protein